eukprot:13912745-Alexandrium_andersonii.AAC.1
MNDCVAHTFSLKNTSTPGWCPGCPLASTPPLPLKITAGRGNGCSEEGRTARWSAPNLQEGGA